MLNLPCSVILMKTEVNEVFDILVVEDDINTQKLLCAVLKRGGYHTVTAQDGIEALEQMEKTLL